MQALRNTLARLITWTRTTTVTASPAASQALTRTQISTHPRRRPATTMVARTTPTQTRMMMALPRRTRSATAEQFLLMVRTKPLALPTWTATDMQTVIPAGARVRVQSHTSLHATRGLATETAFGSSWSPRMLETTGKPLWQVVPIATETPHPSRQPGMTTTTG